MARYRFGYDPAREIYLELRDVFGRLFPELFGDRANPKPVKQGIVEDILNHPLCPAQYTKHQVKMFVKFWVRRREYQLCLAVYSCRYGLDGYPAGEVGNDAVIVGERAVLRVVVGNKNDARTAILSKMDSVVAEKLLRVSQEMLQEAHEPLVEGEVNRGTIARHMEKRRGISRHTALLHEERMVRASA